MVGPEQCSFCGKHKIEVFILVQGPQVRICDECIEITYEILKEEKSKLVK